MAKRSLALDILFFLIIIALACCGISYLFMKFDYNWNWSELTSYVLDFSRGEIKVGILIQGFIQTLLISSFSIILGSVLGFIFALSSISSKRYLKWTARIIIELVRGTPLLVQLFIIYFMFGTVIGIESGFICAVASLSLFASCYISEILRSGIQSIPKGQWDAAHVLGLTKNQTLIYIIIPQALKVSLPSLTGTFVSLIKDSSLVSVLAIMDLTKAGKEMISNTFSVFETWIIVAFLYLIMTYPLSYLASRLEKNLDHH